MSFSASRITLPSPIFPMLEPVWSRMRRKRSTALAEERDQFILDLWEGVFPRDQVTTVEEKEEDVEKEIYCSSRGEGQFISDLCGGVFPRDQLTTVEGEAQWNPAAVQNLCHLEGTTGVGGASTVFNIPLQTDRYSTGTTDLYIVRH